jgi:cobalamin synthase
MSARSWWLLVLAIVVVILFAAGPTWGRAALAVFCLFMIGWSVWYDRRFPLDR